MNIYKMITRVLFCLLAWCALAVAPALAQTITHVPLFTIDDDSGGAGLGLAVSGAGDVNGDGIPDLIVGGPGVFNSPFYDSTISGTARVYSGSDGSVLYSFDGDSVGDRFGFSVSGAGDINGDGFADLIVGAPADGVDATTSGSARVFSGVDGSVLYDFEGDSVGDRFGGSVSGADDVNGDGVPDLIVGASHRGDNNGSNSGRVRVFSGIDGSVLYTFDGDSLNDRFFGNSVSGAGDVNGDGTPDLIVGAQVGNGRARVFSGSDGSQLYNFDGDSLNDGFGGSVSGAGDLNGDGFDDLIVGARFSNELAGVARVFSGVDGSVLYNLEGDFPSGLGESVSGAGDVNGDGVPDLIVGAPSDGNMELVDDGYFFSGSAQVFSGLDGSVIYNFVGDSIGDSFGWSVSGLGDINGDGVDDFVVGAGVRIGFTGDGYVRVFVSQITPLLKGDVDLDGDVDFDDIGPFIAALQAGVFQAEADCDCSTVVDFADIPAFIAILQTQ